MIEIKCKNCGKKFLTPQCWVKRGQSKFCSVKCRNILLRGKNHYSFGKKHSLDAKIKMSKSHQGNKHYDWKGGIKKSSNGYILIYSPQHPYASKNYVMEHRLVMERYLKRFILPNEIVHHINNIITDNKIENLKLMNQSKHMSLHLKIYWKNKKTVTQPKGETNG